MNQNELAELFDTSKQNIGQHISNVVEDSELIENSVIIYFFKAAKNGNYTKNFSNCYGEK